jgi:hypothetical protein
MIHIITADDVEDIMVYSKWLDWSLMFWQLFHRPEDETITGTTWELLVKILGKLNTSELSLKIDNLKYPLATAAKIVIIIPVVVVAICAWKNCCGPALAGTAMAPAPAVFHLALLPPLVFNKTATPVTVTYS